MALTSEVVRSYVAERWPLYLVRALMARGATAQFVKVPARERGLVLSPKVELRGVLEERLFAEFLAGQDLNGASAATWRRDINSWANGAAPSAKSVHRTLRSLESDWLVGLGSVGYRQHAIAMLHALEKLGKRKDAAFYSVAIFASSEYGTERPSDRAERAVLSHGTQDGRRRATQLDEARRSLWGDGDIPSRVSQPVDLSDELLTMWVLFDGLLATKDARQLRRRMVCAASNLATLAGAYAERIRPRKASIVPHV